MRPPGEIKHPTAEHPTTSPVAIYHFSIKPVQRSKGRTATAAAAYRAGCKILDERTGEIHDYTRKGGVESADIVFPAGAPEWVADRAKLWNGAEQAETRKDACVAREFEVALPSELSPSERRRLALDFASSMATEEGCAVDVAIHAPGKEGDNRNWHAHILRTTRKVGPDGFGAKLDTEQSGRKRKDDLEQVRERWAEMTNVALAREGRTERVDHRTLAAQGIDREPTVHLGPAATAIERRGQTSQKTLNQAERRAEQAAKRRAKAAAQRQAERPAAPAPAVQTPAPPTPAPVHQVQAQPVPAPRTAQTPRPMPTPAVQAPAPRPLPQPTPIQVQSPAPRAPAPRPVPERPRARPTAVPIPPPPPVRAPEPAPAPTPTLAECMGEALQRLLDWIKGQRGVLKAIDAERSTCCGPVMQLDDLHCVQRVGKGTYSIHRLDHLDKRPAVGDPTTEIKYSSGLGKVSGPSPRRGIGE